MKYISIGFRCSVKYNIKKYRDDNETLFFDWLITSMNSVIEILGCDNIKNIFYFENIIRDINKPYHNTNSRINIKSLDLCCSIHDLTINYTNNDVSNFIYRYTRRFNRIIEYIKSKEKICFLRYGFVSELQIDKFIEIIKKINPNCDFTLVVIDNNNKNNSEILKQKNLLYIKLNIDIPEENEWTDQFLNWEKIFLDIESNV
jgi:hypothetical protein